MVLGDFGATSKRLSGTLADKYIGKTTYSSADGASVAPIESLVMARMGGMGSI